MIETFVSIERRNMNEAMNKVRVDRAEILISMIGDRPYYEIKYHEVGKDHFNVGYSSYNINFVFKWLKECFEIITDIPVFGEWHNIKEDGLPKEAGYYLVALRRTKYGDNSVYYDMNYIYFRGKTTWATANGSIKAWMALPKAYEGE